MFKDRYDIIQTIQLFSCIVAFALVYGFVSDDDYHKIFDRTETIKYNCDMLIGGWHPDVPTKVIEECRKKIYGNQKI